MLAAAIGLSIFIPPAMAQAPDTKRMEDLGTCLAFSYVNNGLDGKVDPPEELREGIVALRNEYVNEATWLSRDDNAAHTFVVEQLMEQNRIKELKGIEAVRSRYLKLCQEVGQSLESAKSQ
jgi:hypothetical protein